MFNVLKQEGVVAPVTLPLRACLAARSIQEIVEFLRMVDDDGSFPTTITIWSSSSDEVDHEKLNRLINEVGKNRLYLDVPWEADTKLEKTNSAAVATSLSL